MTAWRTTGPALRGVVTAMPESVHENADLAASFGAETMAKIVAATGIERRPVSTSHTVSDLGAVAAERLLQDLGWDRASIGLLIVVTQTPDYPLPSTACVLQNKLGLPMSTTAFDLGLGCSGYAYGLSVASAMMASGGIARALLVAGDMTTRMISEGNRALAPLFGDAVSVTALERIPKSVTHFSDSNARKNENLERRSDPVRSEHALEAGENAIAFDLGSDGSGAPYLISRTGGLAEPGKPELFMDGTQVMAFSLKQVAPSVARALQAAERSIAEIDYVVLHQANAMMLRTLGHKIGASDAQMVQAIRDYGNTSSASIPLALCEHFSQVAACDQVRLLLCGFGVGWSWSTAVWTTPWPAVHAIVRVP